MSARIEDVEQEGDSAMTVEMVSVVHCPRCGYESAETMPTEYCQIHYTCHQCGADLRPKHGDCCIYCSYGSVRCPSQQEAAGEVGGLRTAGG